MKKIKTKRDYTKYSFNGQSYGKAGLVLAVVKQYVVDHPKATLNTLQHVFPKGELNSSFNVVVPIKNAIKRRFFLKKEDLLFNGRAAVTSQWGKDNILAFIKFAKNKLKFEIHKSSKSEITNSNEIKNHMDQLHRVYA